jgi:MFS family permease
VIAAVSLVSAACVLPSFLIGAMAIQIHRDLGINASGIGLAFASFFATASVASAPGGRLADRTDPDVVVRLAAVVCGSMSLVIAWLAESLLMIVACLAVAGAANAVCQTAANLKIVRAVPAHRQGFALALKQSAIPSATLLAGLAVPAVALTVGWRWAFVAGAGMTFFAAGWIPTSAADGQRGSGARSPRSEDDSHTVKPRPDVPMPTMVLLAIAVGLAGIAASSLGSFLVSAAVDADFSEAAAGLLLTASSIIGITVRLFAGAHADRRGGGHFRVVNLMMASGAVAFALLALGVPTAYLLAAPLAFCTAWAWPGLLNLAVVKANPSRPATANGITQTGQFIGGVAGPLLFGVVAQYAGFQAAWLMASGIAAGGATVFFVARARIREL